MKLFAGEAVAVPMTFDKFKEYHGTASVISMESMSTFLGQIQDIFQNSLKAFKSDKEERFIEDTLSDRYEVTAKVKDMRIMDIRHVIISKPESFKGLYKDYLKDLIATSEETVRMFREATPYLKTAVANFINEYSDAKADNIYGYTKLKAVEKKTKELIGCIGDYFPLPANKVKAYPVEVLRSMSEVPELYVLLAELSKNSINPTVFKELEKEVKSVAELVDSLIQHNISTSVLLKNNDAKKELVECITILAHLTEFYASLYARTVNYCSAFKSLTEAIKAQGK
mgnify:FL=1